MYARVLVAVAIAASGLSLAGCARIESSLEPEPIVVTQEATAAAVAAPLEGELTEQPPVELPLWPQSNVVSSENAAEAYSLSLSTIDPYEDVLNGVAAGFERNGWAVTADEDATGTLRSAVLTVSSESHEGVVTIAETVKGTVEIGYIITPVAS